MVMTISYHTSSPLEEAVKSRFKEANLLSEYTKAMIVRSQALELASHFGLDREQVSTAALLHNISKLLPEQDYLHVAEDCGLEILPEERQNPSLLHQKISRILAVEQFNISDKEVLNAIACHTTLRPSATLLDKIIFLTSKLHNESLKGLVFNQQKTPLTLQELNAAVYSCLFNLLHSPKAGAIVHPSAIAALSDLQPQAS